MKALIILQYAQRLWSRLPRICLSLHFYPPFMKMEVYKSNSLQCETIYIKSNNIILYSMISGHHFLFFFKKWIEGTLYIILYYTMNTIIQSCFSFLNRFTFWKKPSLDMQAFILDRHACTTRFKTYRHIHKLTHIWIYLIRSRRWDIQTIHIEAPKYKKTILISLKRKFMKWK